LGIIEREYISVFYTEYDNKIKDLSLLIGNDGFSFAIFSANKELLALREYRYSEEGDQKECLSIINQDRLLKSIFRKTNIGTGGSGNALIPSKLFDQRYPERYLRKAEDEACSEQDAMICIDEVQLLDGKNIHCMPSELKAQLSDYFPGATFKHRDSILIEKYGALEVDKFHKRVCIHLNKRTCQAFYFEKKKLIASGAFEINSPNDFLYYVMLVYQKHELDPESVPLFISGMLKPKSQIFNLLFKYIRIINWTSPDKNIALGDYENSYMSHRDIELFALLLCV